MGCGASNTTGESASKISIIKAQNLQMRPIPSTNTPSWQPGGQGQAVGILSSQADMARSRDAIQENTRPQRQREIPNNPNFFYNEDLYIQQALQQSLVETHGAGNQHGNDEMFNQLLKDTLIMSKKEYEDIGRKAKEDEILKIKDNPEAMKKKLENLLSNERLTTQGKKLPPLAAQKNIKSNKPKEKKDLSLIKAPILMNIGDPKILHTDDAGTNRQVNDTDSEIDIKENEHVKVEPKVPSYNPKLFEQNEIDKKYGKGNMFSLESNEYDEHEIRFVQPNNRITNEDEDYHNLIADLSEDPIPKSRRKNIGSGQDSTMDQNRNRSKIIDDKQQLDDSFDELIDNFGGPSHIPEKPKITNVQKVQVISNRKDSFDDFEF